MSLTDADGTEITVGARVVQLYVFDGPAGAIEANAARVGTVLGLGKVRAHVAFDGATKIIGFMGSAEPATHRIKATHVRVVPDGQEPDPSLPHDWRGWAHPAKES